MAEGTDVPAPPAVTTNPVVTNESATTQSLQVVKSDAVLVNKATTAMDEAAIEGKLTLDRGSAEALMDALAKARTQLDTLLNDVTPKFQQELKFGNNPVADAISARFSELAVGEESSATKVIDRLGYILQDIEDTVRMAVDTTTETDEDLAAAIKKRGAS